MKYVRLDNKKNVRMKTIIKSNYDPKRIQSKKNKKNQNFHWRKSKSNFIPYFLRFQMFFLKAGIKFMLK